MRDLLPCPPCGRQGRPGQGFLAGSIEKPRGSAPRERDHRGGDHPVPSRTRQLSPPSPRVLQREAAGGQGVALAEGAFLSAPGEARRGMLPLRAALRSDAARCCDSRCMRSVKSVLVLPMAFSARWVGRRPAFFRYAPLPDSDFCWSPKALMWTIISKLYTVHWRNAGVGDCASC